MTHVVFGTGPVGLATMAALRRRGERVRMVNRSGSAQVPDDVEVVGGDARDAEFSAVAARGERASYIRRSIPVTTGGPSSSRDCRQRFWPRRKQPVPGW